MICIVSKQSQKRFVADFDEYLEGVVQQAIDKSGDHIRDIKSYFDIWRWSIGAKPAFSLLELALDIPDEVMSHPAIQEMVLTTINMIIIGNVSHICVTSPPRLTFESATSRMVQRQQHSMGEPSEREHYSLYCWVYLQDSACCKLSRFGVRENLYFRE